MTSNNLYSGYYRDLARTKADPTLRLVNFIHYYEKFIEALFPRCYEKNNSIKACYEWRRSGHSIDNEDPRKQCICGKEPLSEVYEYTHRITGEKIPVGNVCYQHFPDSFNDKPSGYSKKDKGGLFIVGNDDEDIEYEDDCDEEIKRDIESDSNEEDMKNNSDTEEENDDDLSFRQKNKKLISKTNSDRPRGLFLPSFSDEFLQMTPPKLKNKRKMLSPPKLKSKKKTCEPIRPSKRRRIMF